MFLSVHSRITCLQVFCYALSPNDGTEWRLRIQLEAEHFIDVSSMSSDMIAKMINEDKIQILVNLNGYTKVTFLYLVVQLKLMKDTEKRNIFAFSWFCFIGWTNTFNQIFMKIPGLPFITCLSFLVWPHWDFILLFV